MSVCPYGLPKKKPSAPSFFDMDSGVFCTVFGQRSVLCKFLDFIARFLYDSFISRVAGFVIDSFVEIILQTPAYKAFTVTEIGRFEMGLIVKAKKLYSAFSTAQDVQQALDSLTLERFDTQQFCENLPSLSAQSIKVRDMVDALNPIGDGFDRLLNKIAINWAIIKFGEYCECDAPFRPPTATPPPPPSTSPGSISCLQDITGVAELLTKIDNFNAISFSNINFYTSQNSVIKLVGEFGCNEIEERYGAGSCSSLVGMFSDNFYANPGGVQVYGDTYEGFTNYVVDQIAELGFDLNDEISKRASNGALIGAPIWKEYFNNNQPYTPPQLVIVTDDQPDPPCNCVLAFNLRFFEARRSSAIVDTNGIGQITLVRETFFPTFPNQLPPLSVTFRNALTAAINADAAEHPFFVYVEPFTTYTSQSCPYFLRLTDDDLLCRDFPLLCSCKEKKLTVEVRIPKECGEVETEEIEYTYYEGASCLDLITTVKDFIKCEDPIQTKDLLMQTPPRILQ
jgi:hypothetical protein